MALVLFSTEKVEPMAPREEVQGIIERLSERTQGVFDGVLLERAMERLDELEREEIALNRTIFDLRKEASELALSMNRLEPLEIALRLDELGKEIFSLSEPSTVCLKEELSGLKERFEMLRFQFAFPEAEELRQDSFQNNFVYRMEKEIAGAKPKKASFLRKCLQSLQNQCRAAEEIFRGKGLAAYLALPKALRADIEGRLFERFGECSVAALARDPQSRTFAARAIMSSLSEKITLRY